MVQTPRAYFGFWWEPSEIALSGGGHCACEQDRENGLGADSQR